MCKCDSEWILELWCDIDAIMRCINLGKYVFKYDVSEDLGVKCTARHFIFFNIVFGAACYLKHSCSSQLWETGFPPWLILWNYCQSNLSLTKARKHRCSDKNFGRRFSFNVVAVLMVRCVNYPDLPYFYVHWPRHSARFLWTLPQDEAKREAETIVLRNKNHEKKFKCTFISISHPQNGNN